MRNVVIAAARPIPADALEGGLSPLDRRVIALAARDPLSSIARPSLIGRVVGRLFGLNGTSRLADPRLEALRAYAVRCWRGVPGASSRFAPCVAAHGYSPAAILREIGKLSVAGSVS